MNDEKKVCAECGAELASDAPQGLCPKCLLKRGLESSLAMATSMSGAETARRSGSSPPAAPGKTIVVSGAVARSLSNGTRVQYFGDYELLEEIARGGMGVVYKARQTSLNRVVAVKMILAGQLASEADVKRFHTEAEAAANLQHPNIVTIHEVGEYEGRHYFSMDYVQGENLATFAKEKPLSAAEAAQLVKTIAEAVHYAHQRGTLHRDLKPHNVLMDVDGQPHVTDFGLAKRVERDSGLTQTGAVMGSPSYMPPEQAAGRSNEVGPYSDVYSIGAILYQLLAGKAPFVAETPIATLRKVIDDEPVAPSKLNANVPPDLETICLKCLEKQPERRYHSARALADELGRFLNHEPILARPAGGLRRAWSWSRRNPWAITGAATLIILTMACFAYLFWQQNRFLQWRQTHPGEILRPGVQPVLITFIWVFFSLFSAMHFIGKPFRRQLEQWKVGGNPIRPRLLLAYGTLGGIMVGYGLLVLFKTIELSVWFADRYALSRLLLGLVQASLAVLIWRGVYVAAQAVSLHEKTMSGSSVEPQAGAAVPESVRPKGLVFAGWRILFWLIVGLFAMASIMNFIFELLVGFLDKSFPMAFGPFFLMSGLMPVVLLLTKSATLRRSRRKIVIGWLLAMGMAGGVACLMHPPQSREQWLLVLLGALVWNVPAAGLLELAARVRAKACGANLIKSSPELAPLGSEAGHWFSTLMLLARQWQLWVWSLCLVVVTCFMVATWKTKSALEQSWHDFVRSRQSPAMKKSRPTPPPEELNFAKTPLLKAVAYWDRVDKSVWRPFEGFAKYLRTGNFKQGTTNDLSTLASDWRANGFVQPQLDSSAAEQVLLALRSVEPQLQELRIASQRPYASLDFPEIGADMFSASPKNRPNRETLTGLASVFAVHASACLQLGQSEAAFSDWQVISKLAKSVERYVWIGSLIDAAGLQVFWEGQIRHQWTTNQLEVFSRGLASIDILRQWDEGLPDELDELCQYMGEPASLALQLSVQPWVFQSQLACTRLFQGFTQHTYDLARTRVFPGRLRNASARIGETWAEQNWMVRNYFGEPEDIDNGIRILTQRQAYVNIAGVVCALERYFAANGAYPAGLEQLSPRFVEKLSHDIITGEPLKYRRTPDGRFLLYSVGWNETDDGGVDLILTNRKETGGDWVWWSAPKQR